MKIFKNKKFFVLSAFILSSCSTLQKTPTINKAIDEFEAKQAYSKVLENYVSDTGEIDFDGLLKNPESLELYVAYVAKKKFTDFTSQESLLAHHLNAYNALSMYTVLQKGIPQTNAGFKKVRFFYLTKMDIGGQQMSLVDYENNHIRSIGEDRVHWALNCMAVSCPRLPKKPFAPETLNKDLQTLSLEFFNSSKNVRLESADKKIYVTEILKFFPKDFVPKKAKSMNEYINLYRQEPVPLNFEIEYIPYDWTINNSNHH